MAKDKEQRIKEILQPREFVIFQAEMHIMVYALPIIFFILGAVMVVMTSDEMLPLIPQWAWDIARDSIYGAKHTNLGHWLMVISMVFIFRFHQERRNLIQIVTNQRVVQVAGAFFPEQHDIGLHYIENIQIRSPGLLNKMAARGDIKIKHKKGKNLDVVFKGVSHPKDFVEHITAACERYAEALKVQESMRKEQAKHN